MQKGPSDNLTVHIAKVEDLAYRLKLLGELVTEKMIMTKILLTLPVQYDFFISAWEATAEVECTKTNLISRLSAEEFRQAKREEGDANALAANSESRLSLESVLNAKGEVIGPETVTQSNQVVAQMATRL